jgi:outer membrane protein OmpA-like peptidoglycan-associated protein
MVELVYTLDSKSSANCGMWVRLPLSLPTTHNERVKKNEENVYSSRSIGIGSNVGACGISMDTMKYANGTDKNIQTAECIVSIAEPAPAAVVIPPKATKVKILEPVMFDWDKADIRADQEPVIEKVAALMAEYPDTALVLDGYASEEGATDYNMALSQGSCRCSKICSGYAGRRCRSYRQCSWSGRSNHFR